MTIPQLFLTIQILLMMQPSVKGVNFRKFKRPKIEKPPKPRRYRKEPIRIGRQQKVHLSLIKGARKETVLEHARPRPPETVKIRKAWDFTPSLRCPCVKCQRRRITLVRQGKLPPEAIRDLVKNKTGPPRGPVLRKGELPHNPTDGVLGELYVRLDAGTLRRWVKDIDKWETDTPYHWKCEECGQWNFKRLRGRNFCKTCGQIYGAPRWMPAVTLGQQDDVCKWHKTKDHSSMYCPLLNQHRQRLAQISLKAYQVLNSSSGRNMTMAHLAKLNLFRQCVDAGRHAWGGSGLSAPLPWFQRKTLAVLGFSTSKELLLTAPVIPEGNYTNKVDPKLQSEYRIEVDERKRRDPAHPLAEKLMDGKTLRYLERQSKLDSIYKHQKAFDKRLESLARNHQSVRKRIMEDAGLKPRKYA
ncbi:hypothetical protein AAMO2058_000702300 [Amorphochlora amoebiformis]|uniref:RanBP2-type domain-containing protein n=1 Tax=Amorphochlora amoebiformis TaxID=1561963 RepID=A0A7S0DA47_9EUKA|mmetsp:Transcript_22055/g.34704  ORF Transcript_22055/g.34704 Transcript_22055/m.34704 type:complete len:413 (+) Transcript_22055:43-1281(+)